VHERLAQTVLEGGGVQTLLAVLSGSVDCSLALVDEAGRVVGERHGSRRLSFDGALELPVVAGSDIATLRAAKANGGFTEEDRLVLHHGQTALALELSAGARCRRRSSAWPATCSRTSSTTASTTASCPAGWPRSGSSRSGRTRHCSRSAGRESPETTRLTVAAALDARGAGYLSAARRDRAAFVVAAADEAARSRSRTRVAETTPGTRLGIGRPSTGRALGRSLLEARAALDAGGGPVSSYRDLGSLELLLGLPSASLEAFVDRVLGPAAASPWLVESLAALLDAGCRWSDAAARSASTGTRSATDGAAPPRDGRHPDDPAQRWSCGWP
jgi:hypothetical protein